MPGRTRRAVTFVERVWYGRGIPWMALRALLWPLSIIFGLVIRARNTLYDVGLLRSEAGPIPAISVGNLTVGGTGKTPFAAFIARTLADNGVKPAVVLRGYGRDEPMVHVSSNPDVPVVVDRDRVHGARMAAVRGAEVVVLDDAFQHRAAKRVVDIVLVSADRWRENGLLLPAGPLREPLSSLERADLALVTRKAASLDRAEELATRLSKVMRDGARVAIAELRPVDLRSATGPASRPLGDLAGQDVLAICAIGDPTSFIAQLRALGARVKPAIYPDHYEYTESDAITLAARSALCVCTLKDAVKLGSIWPREAHPLWYVSQRVIIERGADAVNSLLQRVTLLGKPRPAAEVRGA